MDGVRLTFWKNGFLFLMLSFSEIVTNLLFFLKSLYSFAFLLNKRWVGRFYNTNTFDYQRYVARLVDREAGPFQCNTFWKSNNQAEATILYTTSPGYI